MDLDSILNRVKGYLKSKDNKDINKLLGISANDFSNRKRPKTLLPVIIEWATNEKVSLDWIVYGEEKTNPANSKSDLSFEHLLLVNTYDAAEDSIKEAALTMLKNSAEKSKSTDRKESDCPKLKSE